MSKVTQRAIEFAQNPPVFVKFEPVDYMIYETRQSGAIDYVKDSFVLCDPMEKNDPAVLVIKQTAWTKGEGMKSWVVWRAVRCIQGGENRAFGINGSPARYKIGRRSDVVLWRVPYRWRPAVAKLAGREFESREALEAAMREVE